MPDYNQFDRTIRNKTAFPDATEQAYADLLANEAAAPIIRQFERIVAKYPNEPQFISAVAAKLLAQIKNQFSTNQNTMEETTDYEI